MKIMKIRSLLYLGTLVIVGCTILPPPDDPPKPTPTGCPAACDNLRRLGCPEGQPEGDTCDAVCENAEASGIATVNPQCLATIKSCSEVDGC